MKITSYKKVDGLLKPGKVYDIFTKRDNPARPYESSHVFPGMAHHMRYEGKKGIHHIFKSIIGGYTITQTSIQLLGKFIKEIQS